MPRSVNAKRGVSAAMRGVRRRIHCSDISSVPMQRRRRLDLTGQGAALRETLVSGVAFSVRKIQRLMLAAETRATLFRAIHGVVVRRSEPLRPIVPRFTGRA
jgi:hypothetical protein